MKKIRKQLAEAIDAIEIIDAHEHLRAEDNRLATKVDVFTLFSHYTHADIHSSGLSPDQYRYLMDTTQPLDKRWKIFAPIYENIKFGSYAKAARIAAKEFYGLDISEKTYRQITERIKAENTPGLFRRILHDKCHIQYVINQIGSLEMDQTFFIPVMPASPLRTISDRLNLEKALQYGNLQVEQVKTLDDYLHSCNQILNFWKDSGSVGIKIYSDALLEEPSRVEAEKEFKAIRRARTPLPECQRQHLQSVIEHGILDHAGKIGLVVCVHCGLIWTNWENPYIFHPRNMMHRVQNFRETQFDLYHAGIPWPREMIIYGKLFPNVYLNLCWAHLISPAMVRITLDEWLDTIPVNKIIGFGGDYGSPFGASQVEKVYGHLVLAKENITHVLANRIAEGMMNYEEAIRISKLWFRDNPAKLYRIKGINMA